MQYTVFHVSPEDPARAKAFRRGLALILPLQLRVGDRVRLKGQEGATFITVVFACSW